MSLMKTALLACLLPISAVAAPETYRIDPVHSSALLAEPPRHGDDHGRFDRMSGKITLDRAARTGALEVKVDTASVSTGDAKHEPGSWAPGGCLDKSNHKPMHRLSARLGMCPSRAQRRGLARPQPLPRRSTRTSRRRTHAPSR
jgi:YceI-like domain